MSLLAAATVWISFYSYKSRLQSRFDHVCVPLIGALSLVGTLLYFGTVRANWGVGLGGILVGVAIVYCVSFFVGLKPLEQKVDQSMSVTFLGISSALVTLAIAYLFSGNESVRTLAWIIEAALIFGIYARTMNTWVLIGATIVQILGVAQFVGMQPAVTDHFVVFLVIMVSIFWNLWCLRKTEIVDGLLPDLILLLSSAFWFGYLIRSLDVLPGWSQLDLIIVSELILLIHIVYMGWVKSPVYFGGLIVATTGFFINFSTVMDTSIVLYFWLPFVLFVGHYLLSMHRSDILAKIMGTVIGVGVFIVSSQWVD